MNELTGHLVEDQELCNYFDLKSKSPETKSDHTPNPHNYILAQQTNLTIPEQLSSPPQQLYL